MWSLFVLAAGPAFADSGTDKCQEAATASANCQAELGRHPGKTFINACTVTFTTSGSKVTGGAYHIDIQGGGTYSFQWTQCTPPVPPNPCGSAGSRAMNFGGKVLENMSYCANKPQPDGSIIKCKQSFTPLSPPISNGNGTWNTYGTLTEGGVVCGADGTNGGNDWSNSDGSKPSVAPPTPTPTPLAGDPPKTCGEMSCYDPKTGDYCTTGSSGQICTKGAPPNTGASGGSCATGGDTTICAGSPQAPKPPDNKVPDPPTQTKGTDNYPSADPKTGDPKLNTVTTYSSVGGTVSSGAGPNDVKPTAPAGSSSSGTPPKSQDDTSASGGGDCNNPPNVSGSPALAMVAQQTWQTRCATVQVHKDLAGTGSPTVDPTVPSGQSVWVDTPGSGDATADAANRGTYDMGGMGFASTCPMHDLDIPLPGGSFAIPVSKGCVIGGWIKAIVIAFALFAAAKITAGGNT